MKTIKYRSGFKYQLAEDYVQRIPIRPDAAVDHPFFALTLVGNLTVRAGYAWDGPSGPTVDTANFMRGSLVHDVCYQMMREGFIDRRWKDAADRLLQAICREDGMSALRAWWVYHGVATFGGPSTEAANEPPILTAP